MLYLKLILLFFACLSLRFINANQTPDQLVELVVAAGEPGEAYVEVQDVYNPAHYSRVKVLVMEPAHVNIGPSPVEAEVGNELMVNVQLMGRDSKNNLVPFTDCRHVSFRYIVDDPTIFTVNTGAKQQLPEENRGCSTVTLKAISSGDTKLKVWFGQHFASLDISAYPPLKMTASSDLLMMLGAAKSVSFEGGPRPWQLDSSGYFTDVKSNNDKLAMVNIQGKNFQVYCSENIGEATVTLAIGNRKTPSNILPVVARSQIRICCSVPVRLFLTTKPKLEKNLPACPAYSHSIYLNQPAALELTGFGKCPNDQKSTEERAFDSISSLNVNFSPIQKKLLSVEKLDIDASEPNKIPSQASPKGHSGTVDIDAKTHDFYALGSSSPNTLHKIPSGQLTTRLSLNLVDYAKADPANIVLWNEKNVRGRVIVSGGSGYFWFDNDEIRQIVHATLHSHPKESIAHIELSPLTQGLTKLTLYDLCIDESKLQIGIKIKDINRIQIESADMVESGAQIPLNVIVEDVEGQPFSLDDAKLMGLELTSSNDFVKIQKANLLTYEIRGQKIGTSVLTASARSSSGKIIRSSLHQIQVFEPLHLDPRLVTLIPESVFQLQILGGPQSLPSLKFSLNNSAVASVLNNGLITSTTTLGYTSITATTERNIPISKDTVVLKVVSLAGVKIFVTTTTVEEGEILFARIQGLDDDETPFAFGGADYPLNVEWKLSADDVLYFTSPLSDFVNELSANKFGVQLLAKRNGRATLYAKVTVHPSATKHFQSRTTEFSDSIQITVEPGLKLISPENSPKSLLMTTETSLDLSTNRPHKNVLYSMAMNGNLVWLSGENKDTLISGNQDGNAALKIQYISSAHNETKLALIEILPVNSIHLVAQIPQLPTSANNLVYLPRGTWIRLVVTFRDVRGRLFDATNTQIRFRPHRFDLTEIIAGDNNRTFSIHLKQSGETVFKIWDAADPRKSAFIRLPVADLPTPFEVENVTELPTTETKQLFTMDHNRASMLEDYLEPKTKIGKSTGIVEALSYFFDNYLQLILVFLILCVSVILLCFGFRMGLLTERGVARPEYINMSQQDSMDGSYGYWRSLSKPLITSTPVDPLPKARKSPRKSYEEQQSPLNFSNKSSGSSNEPFLWSTQDSLKAGSPAVVNRLYRS